MADTVETRTGTGIASGTLRRIDHVAMAVRDAEVATTTLCSMLGLVLTGDEMLPELNARLCYLSTNREIDDGSVLQLVQPTGPSPVWDFLDQHGEGLHHVCFVVQDAASTLAVADGDSGRSVLIGGRGRRCAFLNMRPHGLLVELIEAQPWDPNRRR